MKTRLLNLAVELELELKGNILNFWIENALDKKYGGFYGYLSNDNSPLVTASKGSIQCSRILWTYSAAYRMFGDQEYLKMAEYAYDYLTEYFIDPEYGGVFWELEYTGEILNPKKQLYAIAFALYGMTEFYRASGNKDALGMAVNLYETIEANGFDNKNNGYTEAFSRDWQEIKDFRLSEKDTNECKSMNTHLHIMEAYESLYISHRDKRLKNSLENIVHLFLEKFIDKKNYHLSLFFDKSWTNKTDRISFGHEIECSWLLYRTARSLNNLSLINDVIPVSIRMAAGCAGAIDPDHGLIHEQDLNGKVTDTDKHWWPQAEAMVGFLNAYQVSGDPQFANLSLNSWEFISKYLINRKYGEWFSKVDRKGNPSTVLEKAGFWKSPYHNGRACMEIIRKVREEI